MRLIVLLLALITTASTLFLIIPSVALRAQLPGAGFNLEENAPVEGIGGGCAPTTTDPFLNQLFCETTSMLDQFSIPNNAKEQTWNPPTTSAALGELCATQANSAGIDPVGYCQGISSNCQRVALTLDECYAQFFLAPAGFKDAPQEVLNSALAKYNGASAAADAGSAAINQLYGPGSGWAESFGLMGQ